MQMPNHTYKVYKTTFQNGFNRYYWKLVYNAALRLGLALPLDDLITFNFEGITSKRHATDNPKHNPNNEVLVGTLEISGRKFDQIVLVHNTEFKNARFTTFWPDSNHADAGESTTEPLIELAKHGEPIPPQEVVNDMHPEFIENPGANPLVLINRLKNIAEAQTVTLIEIAKKLQDDIEKLEGENKRLKAENDRLKAGEKNNAANEGQVVVEGQGKILKSVETNVMVRNSINTVLIFEDGTRKTIKIATFDKDLSVTRKAQSLIGKRVTTTCWDPISKPGLFSNQDYFRNIYPV